MGLCVQREWVEGGGGYMGATGNRDSQLVSRNVLNDFTDDTLAISAGSIFQNGTPRMLAAYWRRSSTSVWVGWVKMDSMGNFNGQWVILNMDIRSPWRRLMFRLCWTSRMVYL